MQTIVALVATLCLAGCTSSISQADVANQLADAYCEVTSDTDTCRLQVFGGFCGVDGDLDACDGLLSQGMVRQLNHCVADTLLTKSIPATCWTLFQF